MMIELKGIHIPKSVVLYAVYFYVRFGVSCGDLEEIMGGRGLVVDHATLNRWVVKVSPVIAAEPQKRKRPTANFWRMDGTYVKVNGEWKYYYSAVDRHGQILGFMLSERRNKAAARRFFNRAIGENSTPSQLVIDQSGANLACIEAINVIRKSRWLSPLIKAIQSKYLNNRIEHHRFIKRITRSMLGFKAFHSPAATLAGIETAHMIRKTQITLKGANPFEQFAKLAV